MDPEHRQELEENDLEVFLMNFKKWWNKHGTKVVLVLLVAALALFAKQMYDKRQAERQETMWSDLANATSPEAARSLAMSYAEPGYKAKAWLKGADLLLTKAMAPDQTPATPETIGPDGVPVSPVVPVTPVTPADREATLQQAANYYQGVLDVSGAEVVYRLNARLGLATIAETRGDFDAADKQYEQILTDAGTEYSAIAAQAKARQAMLTELRQPVKFGPEPVAPPEPVADPAATTPGADSLNNDIKKLMEEPPPAPAPK